jgi:anti-sigma factor RsiW
MSECREVQELLLEAAPEALRGLGSSEVARHVRTCRGCAAAAERILDGTAELRGALAALAPATSPASHVARFPRRVRGLRTLLPLAAAAAVLLVLFGREPGGPFVRADDTPFHVPVVRVPERPVVNATGAGAVAVIRTIDPAITVVWTFRGE